MPIYSDNVIRTVKKTVDITSILTKSTAELLTYEELQHKNQFEILFTPDTSGDFISMAKAIGFAALDTLIVKMYVQTIEATFVSYSYEKADNKSYIKDLEYPESVKITFIENELGTVRSYINSWSKSIAAINDDGSFVFEDDQIANKRNAILTPLMKNGLPSGAWVQFKGLKFMNVEPITFDQSSPENMLIEVNFSCDNCWWKTPF